MQVYFKSLVINTLLVLLVMTFQVAAQSGAETFTVKNVLYVEFGGTSGRYAVNYGRIIHQKEKLKLNVSAGFSMWHHTMDSKTIWLPVLPLEISAFYGRKSHHLELGLGVISYLGTSLDIDLNTYESIEKVVFDVAIPSRIGYRYQKPGGGFFFRAAYTPYFAVPRGARENWVFEPIMAGLSIGKSF